MRLAFVLGLLLTGPALAAAPEDCQNTQTRTVVRFEGFILEDGQKIKAFEEIEWDGSSPIESTTAWVERPDYKLIEQARQVPCQ